MQARIRNSLRGLRSVPGRGIFAITAFFLLCVSTANALANGQTRLSEYDVKAAYLLNFGKFVRVPASGAPRDRFDICVIGTDPMGHVLDSLADNEQIDGRPVRIRRVTEAADARSCDVAYLSTTDSARIDSELAALGNADVLTVGDASNFLEHGGMIQFVMVSNRVRFSVNLNAVHRTRLVLSSELLRVAFSITGKASGEVQP